MIYSFKLFWPEILVRTPLQRPSIAMIGGLNQGCSGSNGDKYMHDT